MDAPLSPGNWTYAAGEARFGTGDFGGSRPELRLACNRATGQVGIVRAGTVPVPTQMRIRTETQDRTIEIRSFKGDPAELLPEPIAANDPLLDAMAFSKGRFAVEVPGLPTLYIEPKPPKPAKQASLKTGRSGPCADTTARPLNWVRRAVAVCGSARARLYRR